MTRVLALIEQDETGAALGRLLAKMVREAALDLEVVGTWSAAIQGFVPDAPASFVVDARMIGRGLLVKELHNVRSEFRQTRMILLGNPQDVRVPELKELIRHAWIDDFITSEELGGAPGVDGLADRLHGSLATRVRRALAQARGGRPTPALVERALHFAFQGTDARSRVTGPRGMAEEVGGSPRTLNRWLRRELGLCARDLNSWVRILRAVHELDRDPSLTARELATVVGYSDPSGLARALDRTLGARLEDARAMGLAGALERFSALAGRTRTV